MLYGNHRGLSLITLIHFKPSRPIKDSTKSPSLRVTKLTPAQEEKRKEPPQPMLSSPRGSLSHSAPAQSWCSHSIPGAHTSPELHCPVQSLQLTPAVSGVQGTACSKSFFCSPQRCLSQLPPFSLLPALGCIFTALGLQIVQLSYSPKHLFNPLCSQSLLLKCFVFSNVLWLLMLHNILLISPVACPLYTQQSG